jgi:hypothetical protein
MLHLMRVHSLHFAPGDLEIFADELARDFERMAAYEPA